MVRDPKRPEIEGNGVPQAPGNSRGKKSSESGSNSQNRKKYDRNEAHIRKPIQNRLRKKKRGRFDSKATKENMLGKEK